MSARKAFDEGPWPRMGRVERAAAIHRLADLMEERADDLATHGRHEHGQAVPAGQARRRPLGVELPVLRRPPARRRRRGLPDGLRAPHLQRVRAGRRRRGDQPVELPADDGVVEDRAGDRVGQHLHHQAERGHPRVGDAARSPGGRGRLPARACSTCVNGYGAPGGLDAHRRRPGRPGDLHRLVDHRQARHGVGRRRTSRRSRSSSAARAPTSSSRTPTSTTPCTGRSRRSSATPGRSAWPGRGCSCTPRIYD